MAEDTNIRFKISSVFAGEGFQKANAAVTTTSKEVGKAAGVVGRLGGALGQLDGAAGQVTRSVQGFVASFAQLGLIGGAIAGVQLAFQGVQKLVDGYIQKIRDETKAMKDAITADAKAMGEALKAGLAAHFARIGTEADNAAKSIDRVRQANEKVAQAMGRGASSQEKQDLVNLKLENLNKVISAETEDAKALAKAEGDLAIAMQERANAQKSATRDLETAQRNEQKTDWELRNAKANHTSASMLVARLEEELADKTTSGIFSQKQIKEATDNLTKARELLAKRTDELVTAEGNHKAAVEDVKTSEQKRKTAYDESSMTVIQAEKTLNDLKAAQEKLKKAEEERAKLLYESKNAQVELDEAAKRREEIVGLAQSDRTIALAKLAEAEKKSQEWEARTAELAKEHHNSLQQINMKRMVEAYEKSPNLVIGAHKEMVLHYKEWLEHQGENPFKAEIKQLNLDLEGIDEKLKYDIAQNAKESKESADALKVIKEKLASLGLK